MPKLRFGIRSVLLVFIVVAIGLIGWLERQRYLREHVFIRVLDKATGAPLESFLVRTSITAKDVYEKSEWQTAKGGLFTLKVPIHCELTVEAKAVGLPIGRKEELKTLVLPEASHDLTLRVTDGTRVSGLVVDDETGAPIEHAEVAPATRMGSKKQIDEISFADPQGRFEFYCVKPKPNTLLYVYHPEYEYLLTPLSATTARLKRGKTIQGRVIDTDTKEPISDCSVVVLYREENLRKETANNMLDALADTSTKREVVDEFIRVRETTTDRTGHFKLVVEPGNEKTPIRFRQHGWQDVVIKTEELLSTENTEHLVELNRSPIVFSGKVVDADGQSVPKFQIVFKQHSRNWPTNNDFEDPEGRFQFRANPNSRLERVQFTIKTNGFETYEGTVGIERESRLDQTLVLSKGYQVRGKIVSGSHSKYIPEVFLMDLRSCSSVSEALGQLASAAKRTDGSDWTTSQAEIRSDGSFEFNHVANGIHGLHVKYNGQTVCCQPVVVDSNDLTIESIDIPPTGTLQGIVKNWKKDKFNQPFSIADTVISPFETYQLVRRGFPSGKTFHVDHLGAFNLQEVLVGEGTIDQNFSNHSARQVSEVVGFEFQVRKDKTTTFTQDSVVLCELEFDNELPAMWQNGRLSGTSYDRFWIEEKRDASGKYIWQVLANTNMQSDNQYVEFSTQSGTFSVDVDFKKGRPPQRFYVRPHWLLTRRRLSSSSQAYFFRNKRQVSTLHLNYNERLLFYVEGVGNVDIVIHDPINGWAHYQDVQLRDSIDLGNLELQQGGNIEFQPQWKELNAFPSKATARNLETGQTETLQQIYLSGIEKGNVFNNLMPGRWKVELCTFDPIQGEITLAKTEVELKGTETVGVDLPKLNP